jgi:DNA-binding response OmpR family regulator
MGDPETYRFGSFCLFPARRELLLDGAPQELGSRAFDVLLALVRRRGNLASKDELMAEVWPGRVVEENNLQAQISALRKVLARDLFRRTSPANHPWPRLPFPSIAVLPFANMSVLNQAAPRIFL